MWSTSSRCLPSALSASRARAMAFTPHAQRHVDDDESSIASPDASWEACRCLVSPRFMYTISHGSRRTTTPLSANAKLAAAIR